MQINTACWLKIPLLLTAQWFGPVLTPPLSRWYLFVRQVRASRFKKQTEGFITAQTFMTTDTQRDKAVLISSILCF